MPFLVISWLVAAISGAVAQTPTVPDKPPAVTGVTITNAGTFTGETTSAPAQAGQQSPTGTVGTEVSWHFVSGSPNVAAKVGTQFGIEFRIDGTPPGDGVTLHLALTFPPQAAQTPAPDG